MFVLTLMGCGTTSNKQGGVERDPFMMSHLTHQKNDPLFAGTESGETFDTEELSRSTGRSVSRKLFPGDGEGERQVCVTGRLESESGTPAIWRLRLLEPAAGRVVGLSSDPRLAMFNNGDLVRVEGTIAQRSSAHPALHVESISLLNE